MHGSNVQVPGSHIGLAFNRHAYKVIARTLANGLQSLPGFATPTEAFAALDAGAHHLKLFPAATYGPGHVRQVMAVLPAGVTVWAVGGVGADDFKDWWDVGVRAFGLGSLCSVIVRWNDASFSPPIAIGKSSICTSWKE